MHCWGHKLHKQLNAPKNIDNPLGIVIADRSGCAIFANDAKCWGSLDIPDEIRVKPVALAIGFSFGCGFNGEKIACWGSNKFGQFNVPAKLKNPIFISAGSHHACAVDKNEISCWGNNNDGQTDIPKNIK